MRYPGGKGSCFRHLINLMPPHHTYIETHLVDLSGQCRATPQATMGALEAVTL